eukprot:m.178109 g.178109  ORF g.178109 m.178109 type:complete len:1338 (+) comp13555_c0_seq1:144-4157(+)
MGKGREVKAAYTIAKQDFATDDDDDWADIYQQFLNDRLRKLDTALVKKDDWHLFQNPVTDDIAPLYSHKISHPMDMGTMRDKIESDKYSTLEEYKHDFDLMMKNCFIYNGPETNVHEMGKIMEKHGEKVFAREIPKYEKALAIKKKKFNVKKRKEAKEARREAKAQAKAQKGKMSAPSTPTVTSKEKQRQREKKRQELQQQQLLAKQNDMLTQIAPQLHKQAMKAKKQLHSKRGTKSCVGIANVDEDGCVYRSLHGLEREYGKAATFRVPGSSFMPSPFDVNVESATIGARIMASPEFGSSILLCPSTVYKSTALVGDKKTPYEQISKESSHFHHDMTREYASSVFGFLKKRGDVPAPLQAQMKLQQKAAAKRRVEFLEKKEAKEREELKKINEEREERRKKEAEQQRIEREKRLRAHNKQKEGSRSSSSNTKDASENNKPNNTEDNGEVNEVNKNNGTTPNDKVKEENKGMASDSEPKTSDSIEKKVSSQETTKVGDDEKTPVMNKTQNATKGEEDNAAAEELSQTNATTDCSKDALPCDKEQGNTPMASDNAAKGGENVSLGDDKQTRLSPHVVTTQSGDCQQTVHTSSAVLEGHTEATSMEGSTTTPSTTTPAQGIQTSSAENTSPQVQMDEEKGLEQMGIKSQEEKQTENVDEASKSIEQQGQCVTEIDSSNAITETTTKHDDEQEKQKEQEKHENDQEQEQEQHQKEQEQEQQEQHVQKDHNKQEEHQDEEIEHRQEDQEGQQNQSKKQEQNEQQNKQEEEQVQGKQQEDQDKQQDKQSEHGEESKVETKICQHELQKCKDQGKQQGAAEEKKPAAEQKETSETGKHETFFSSKQNQSIPAKPQSCQEEEGASMKPSETTLGQEEAQHKDNDCQPTAVSTKSSPQESISSSITSRGVGKRTASECNDPEEEPPVKQPKMNSNSVKSGDKLECETNEGEAGEACKDTSLIRNTDTDVAPMQKSDVFSEDVTSLSTDPSSIVTQTDGMNSKSKESTVSQSETETTVLTHKRREGSDADTDADDEPSQKRAKMQESLLLHSKKATTTSSETEGMDASQDDTLEQESKESCSNNNKTLGVNQRVDSKTKEIRDEVGSPSKPKEEENDNVVTTSASSNEGQTTTECSLEEMDDKRDEEKKKEKEVNDSDKTELNSVSNRSEGKAPLITKQASTSGKAATTSSQAVDSELSENMNDTSTEEDKKEAFVEVELGDDEDESEFSELGGVVNLAEKYIYKFVDHISLGKHSQVIEHLPQSEPVSLLDMEKEALNQVEVFLQRRINSVAHGLKCLNEALRERRIIAKTEKPRHPTHPEQDLARHLISHLQCLAGHISNRGTF